jgi:carbon storage regulator
MLILTRKPEQRIIVNGNIVISILAVEGDRVKIGIQAPADISILREEIQSAVSGENKRALELTQDRRGLLESLQTLHRAPASTSSSTSSASSRSSDDASTAHNGCAATKL